MAVNKEYILGSDSEELERLEFQHKVWSKEAFALWERMGLSLGSSILDLGCGPGFTTLDIAVIAGETGNVQGVDKTESFIRYAEDQINKRRFSNTTFKHINFETDSLGEGQFDAVYSRWVMSWVKDVEAVIQNVSPLIKKGGMFMFQEYLDWSTLAIYPKKDIVDRVIAACRESWVQMDSEINIGPLLPEILIQNDFEIIHQEPLPKMGKSKSLVWQWPGTFLKIYSEKLVEYGLLTKDERNNFLVEWGKLETNPNAFMVGPLMMEVVGRKQ